MSQTTPSSRHREQVAENSANVPTALRNVSRVSSLPPPVFSLPCEPLTRRQNAKKNLDNLQESVSSEFVLPKPPAQTRRPVARMKETPITKTSVMVLPEDKTANDRRESSLYRNRIHCPDLDVDVNPPIAAGHLIWSINKDKIPTDAIVREDELSEWDISIAEWPNWNVIQDEEGFPKCSLQEHRSDTDQDVSLARDEYQPPTFFRYAVPMGDNTQYLAPIQEVSSASSGGGGSDDQIRANVDVVVPVATLVHAKSARVVPEPPCYRRKALWRLVFFQVIIAAIVAVLVMTLLPGPTPDPTSSPTPTPTIMVDLGQLFPDIPDEFRNSYNSTLEWFGMESIPFSTEYLQRFVLTWFWFHTTHNGQAPWLSCNPPSSNETEACVFLVDPIVDWNLLCYNPRNETRWLSSDDECAWAGLVCNQEGLVTEMNLKAVGLRGKFPYFLFALKALRKIDFSYGGIYGELPARMDDFPRLEELDLSWNQLFGSLPSSLFASQVTALKMTRNRLNETLPRDINVLKDVYLDNNFLPGPLPNVVGAGELEQLQLGWNEEMSGATIPSNWGDLTNLRLLDMQNNGLVGTIPEVWSNLTQMEVLNLDQNRLHGILPEMPWPNLRKLVLHRNDFNETFPESLYGHAGIWEIDLSSNRFQGQLLDEFHGMNALRLLNLRDNAFTGTLPLSIANATSLNTLRLQENEFEGPVPTEYCDLGHLSNLEADCLIEPEYDSGNECHSTRKRAIAMRPPTIMSLFAILCIPGTTKLGS